MTEADHVKTILVIADNESDARRLLVLSWAARGKAEVSSRIRLNGTQRVVAVAQLSDGTFWSDAQRDIEVREAACTDGN